eukprot:1512049-Pyramimonas_sp.AAC.1
MHRRRRIARLPAVPIGADQQSKGDHLHARGSGGTGWVPEPASAPGDRRSWADHRISLHHVPGQLDPQRRPPGPARSP